MKHPRRLRKYAFLSVGLTIALTIAPAFAQLAPAETDKEVLRISRYLKPIDDLRWKDIAGERISEKYQIAKGDTLSDISKRLFGDPKYWPKIWAMNNNSITNPHLIRKGNAIAFLPGSGTDFPQVTIQAQGSGSSLDSFGNALPSEPREGESPIGSKPPQGRANEWKRLPRQAWEEVSTPKQDLRFEDNAIDERSKVKTSEIKFDLHSLATSQTLEPFGRIVGANSPSSMLSQGDRVYIRSERKLRTGDVFDLTAEPIFFKDPGSETHGTYSYPMQGRVRIIDERAGLYLGQIISANDVPTRESFLVSAHPRIRTLTPIPGTSPLEATVLLDHRQSTFLVAQFKQVFLNRGSDDGIAPGMIFRAYQQKDDILGTQFEGANLVLTAELMVVQVSERLSVAVITKSPSALQENITVTLTTEKNILRSVPNLREKTPEEDLEKLDDADQLRDDEKRELEQLERWKGNPPPTSMPTPEAQESLSPSPETQESPAPSPEASQPISPEDASSIPPVEPESAAPAPTPTDDIPPAETAPSAETAPAIEPPSSMESPPALPDDGTVPPPPPPPEFVQ